MNTAPLCPAALLPANATALTGADCAFVADWRRFLFVHFSLPPDVLRPHVPFELDLFAGRAFVSLVYFTLERMRPRGTGAAGELLLRPISNHPFLNVRTYVRHAGGAGICFLAEWIPNRLSLHLGPLTYGLPYRYGRFEHEIAKDDGISWLRVADPACRAELHLAAPTHVPPEELCEAGTDTEFLLERYLAYTFGGGKRRWFRVAHAPWRAARVDWLRINPGLVEVAFPWFRGATYHSAHRSAGVCDVAMGFPHTADAA